MPVALSLGILSAAQPLLALGLGLALSVGALLMLRPTLGVYLLILGGYYDVFFLPTGFALLGPGDFAAFAVLPTWLLHVLSRKRPYTPPKHWPLLALFVLLSLLSLAFGIDSASGRGPYLRMVTYVLAMFALVDLCREHTTLQRALYLMVACALGHALISMAIGGGQLRNGGLFDEPNVLAHHLNLGALACAGLLIHPTQRVQRAPLTFALALILLGIVLTISRGAYLSLGVGLFWMLRRQRWAIVAALIVAGLTFTLVQSLDPARGDFIERRMQMNDSSVSIRWQTYQNALKAIAEHPYLGIGYAQFTQLEKVLDLPGERGRGAHNYYLAIFAETGVIAALCLFGFVSLHGLRLHRTRRRLASAAADDEPPDLNQRLAHWLTTVFQAMLLYHAIWLLVSGGNRVFDWTVLGLYLSASILGQRRLKERAAAHTEPPAA